MRILIAILIFQSTAYGLNDTDYILCSNNMVSGFIEKLRSLYSGRSSCQCGGRGVPENQCSPYVEKRVMMDHCQGRPMIFKSMSPQEACDVLGGVPTNLSGERLEDYYRQILKFDDPSVLRVTGPACYRGRFSSKDKKQIPAQYYFYLSKLRAGALSAISQIVAADTALGFYPFASDGKSCPVEGIPQTGEWCKELLQCRPGDRGDGGKTEALAQMIKEISKVQGPYLELKKKIKFLNREHPNYGSIDLMIRTLEANFPALADKAYLSKSYTGKITEAFEDYLQRSRTRNRELLEEFRRATQCLQSRDGGSLLDSEKCKGFDQTLAVTPDDDYGADVGSKALRIARDTVKDFKFNMDCRVGERNRLVDENRSYLTNVANLALTVGTSGVGLLRRAGIVALERAGASAAGRGATAALADSGSAGSMRAFMEMMPMSTSSGGLSYEKEMAKCNNFAEKIAPSSFNVDDGSHPPKCSKGVTPEIAQARDCYWNTFVAAANSFTMNATVGLVMGRVSNTGAGRTATSSSVLEMEKRYVNAPPDLRIGHLITEIESQTHVGRDSKPYRDKVFMILRGTGEGQRKYRSQFPKVTTETVYQVENQILPKMRTLYEDAIDPQNHPQLRAAAVAELRRYYDLIQQIDNEWGFNLSPDVQKIGTYLSTQPK